MKNYKSKSGKLSGVNAFEIGSEFIKVKFGDEIYIYTYSSTGKKDVEKMKILALESEGLSTYITQNNPKFSIKYKS